LKINYFLFSDFIIIKNRFLSGFFRKKN